jgi:type I restriction enzyme S subunit
MIAVATENKKTVWLGEFPSHWEVLRIKNLFQEMENRSETGSEELLSVSHYTGVTLKRESLENEDDHLTNAESLVGYKLVEKQDLVINIMLAWNGSLGISPFNGITSPAYCVYKIKGENNPEYFGYLFSTAMFKAEFRRNSTGIIDSRLRLYSDKFFSIFSVVPPKEEQDEIVQHIKAQGEKVNQFIQKKKRFIELLKEQKSTIIKSKFLKTDETWKRRKISHSFKIIGSGTTPESGNSDFYDEGEINWINTGDLNDGYLESCEKKITQFAFDKYSTLKIYPKGTLLIALYGATIGKVSIMNIEGCTNQACCAMFGSEIFYTEFLFQWFIANRDVLIQMSYGGGQPNISQEIIRQLRISCPSIEEQKQIVSHIKTETATIDTAIAKAEREIELIKEYKEAMISEAVMGTKNNIQV